jgi:hypothetical protein
MCSWWARCLWLCFCISRLCGHCNNIQNLHGAAQAAAPAVLGNVQASSASWADGSGGAHRFFLSLQLFQLPGGAVC